MKYNMHTSKVFVGCGE